MLDVSTVGGAAPLTPIRSNDRLSDIERARSDRTAVSGRDLKAGVIERHGGACPVATLDLAQVG